MSIVSIHHYIAIRVVFAVPFLTKHGIGFCLIACDCIFHVHQIFPVSRLKRSPYPQTVVPFKPSKPSRPKQEVLEKPVQAPITNKTVPTKNQEQEFFAGSVTMGAAPSPRHVPIPMFCLREKSASTKSQSETTVLTTTNKPKTLVQKQSSVTMGAAPSPRDVSIPMFCVREKSVNITSTKPQSQKTVLTTTNKPKTLVRKQSSDLLHMKQNYITSAATPYKLKNITSIQQNKGILGQIPTKPANHIQQNKGILGSRPTKPANPIQQNKGILSSIPTKRANTIRRSISLTKNREAHKKNRVDSSPAHQINLFNRFDILGSNSIM